MSKEKKAKANAKRAAWAAKKEKEGNRVIAWIGGILIGLGLIFWLSTALMA